MDSREDLGLVCKNPDRAHIFFFGPLLEGFCLSWRGTARTRKTDNTVMNIDIPYHQIAKEQRGNPLAEFISWEIHGFEQIH